MEYVSGTAASGMPSGITKLPTSKSHTDGGTTDAPSADTHPVAMDSTGEPPSTVTPPVTRDAAGDPPSTMTPPPSTMTPTIPMDTEGEPTSAVTPPVTRDAAGDPPSTMTPPPSTMTPPIPMDTAGEPTSAVTPTIPMEVDDDSPTDKLTMTGDKDIWCTIYRPVPKDAGVDKIDTVDPTIAVTGDEKDDHSTGDTAKEADKIPTVIAPAAKIAGAATKLATSATKAMTHVAKTVTKAKEKFTSKTRDKKTKSKATKETKTSTEPVTKYFKTTDTRDTTTSAKTKEMAVKKATPTAITKPSTLPALKEIPNDISIRQKPVSKFTKEEFEYFQKVYGSSTLFDKPRINRKVDKILLDKDNKFKGIVPCLREFEFTEVVDQLHNKYCILMVGAGETAIFTNEQTNTKVSVDVPATHDKPAKTVITGDREPTTHEMIPLAVTKLAADMAMNTLEHQKPGRTMLPHSIKIAKITENIGSFKDAKLKCEAFVDSMKHHEANKKTVEDPTDSIKFENYLATCHCNRPHVTNLTKPTIECSNCTTLAHQGCVDIKKHKTYTCAPCSIDIDGIVWGAGRAPNSCPVDNQLAHFALRGSKDPNFKKEMERFAKSSNRAVKALGLSVGHAMNNDSIKSHKAWADILENEAPPGGSLLARNGLHENGTWFGGTDERFYDYLNEPLGKFTRLVETPCRGECSVSKKKGTKSLDATESLIGLTTNPQEYLLKKSTLYSYTKEPCTETPFGDTCKGTVEFAPMTLSWTSKEVPLYLVVRNQASLNGPEDFLNFPKEINVSGQPYQLGMLSLFDRSKEHFTSLHHVNNEFVFYDGMTTSKKKFRRAMPSDYMQDTIFLDHVLYVKTFNKKMI